MNIVSERSPVHCDRQIPCLHGNLPAVMRGGSTIQEIKRNCDFVKDAQKSTIKV